MKTPTTYATALLLALALLAGCGSETGTDDTASANTTGAVEPASATADAVVASSNIEPHTIDADFDPAEVEHITLGSTIVASDAVSVDGTTVTITAAGAYELTGTLTDGQIVVDAGDDDVVQLILNGADITNADGAAIAIMNADTAVVLLADGSTNSVRDGTTYVLPEGDDEPNATLFSKSDLTITGNGSLAVDGGFNDGIASKDGLVIESGTITVDALDDGIRGRDYVLIQEAAIDITAGGDGIKADNDEDPERGYIAITGGSIDVRSSDDGIQAVTDVHIAGGELTISTADDGIKSDRSITIDDGSIVIADSFEGIESEVITINGGTIDVTSDDDGINVATTDDTTTDTATELAPAAAGGRPPGGPGGGRGGGPGGAEVVGDNFVHINGGTTTITVTGSLDEQGDGIDANGHVVMTGGTVVISGPTDTRNSALDYSGGSFEVTGGTLVGTNINGRNSEGVDATSSQASLYITFGSTMEAGTLVHIRSADGADLVTFAPSNPYDVVVFTSPELVSGETYEVFTGGTGSDESSPGIFGAYSPGTAAGTVTAS